MDVAVPVAAAAHVAEQGRRLTLPGQPGELVHRGDHERRRQPVDLLIHREHRKALSGGPAFGERALRQRIAAEHEHPTQTRIRSEVGRLNPGAAPWAALDLPDRQPVRAAVVDVLQLRVGLLEPLRRYLGADPQADPERLAAPGRRVGSAAQLGGAHHRGSSLELLGGEQPQGVSHQHRHPGAPVDGSFGTGHNTLPAAGGERVRGQAEIGLGLAAAGREEQQLNLGQVAAAARQLRLDQAGNLHEHEGQLERPPGMRPRTVR